MNSQEFDTVGFVGGCLETETHSVAIGLPKTWGYSPQESPRSRSISMDYLLSAMDLGLAQFLGLVMLGT